MTTRSGGIFTRAIVFAAIRDSFGKLDPRTLIRNPVIFIVELGSVITTVIFFRDLFGADDSEPLWFTGTIALWLWLTVLFANFAEAVAEGRGKAQANALQGHAHDDHGLPPNRHRRPGGDPRGRPPAR